MDEYRFILGSMALMAILAIMIAIFYPYWVYLGLVIARKRDLRLTCVDCDESLKVLHVLINTSCPHCQKTHPLGSGKVLGMLLLFLIFGWSLFQLGVPSAILILVSPIFIAIAAADIQYRKIPNLLLGLLLIVLVFYQYFNGQGIPWESMGIAALFCFLLLIIGKGNIGMGDIKMMWIFSLLFPWLYWVFFITISNFLALLSKPFFFRKEKYLPFGVHLSIGAFFMWMYMLAQF